jgi:hypothetical protein
VHCGSQVRSRLGLLRRHAAAMAGQPGLRRERRRPFRAPRAQAWSGTRSAAAGLPWETKHSALPDAPGLPVMIRPGPVIVDKDYATAPLSLPPFASCCPGGGCALSRESLPVFRSYPVRGCFLMKEKMAAVPSSSMAGPDKKGEGVAPKR